MATPEPSHSASGLQPTQVAWKPVGRFTIAGTRVYVGDSWMIGAEGVEVPVTPGIYDIDTRIFFYGSDDRVAVLRGRLQGSAPDGSRPAGEFGVDVASAGVIDADAFDRWSREDPKGCEAWQERFCESGQPDLAGFFPCEPIGGAMLYSSTGFGDGVYKVATLLEGDKPVGFEATFLEEGRGYFLDNPEVARGGPGATLGGPGATHEGPGGAYQRPRPKPWKAWLMLAVAAPLALGALVVGVTVGLAGVILLKLAGLLRRLR